MKVWAGRGINGSGVRIQAGRNTLSSCLVSSSTAWKCHNDSLQQSMLLVMPCLKNSNSDKGKIPWVQEALDFLWLSNSGPLSIQLKWPSFGVKIQIKFFKFLNRESTHFYQLNPTPATWDHLSVILTADLDLVWAENTARVEGHGNQQGRAATGGTALEARWQLTHILS